jgi:hypothetical protein
MTKFISCENGSYANMDMIYQFSIENKQMPCQSHYESIDGYCVVAYTRNSAKIICSGFENQEEAQEWLDKFMEKHGLCI